MPLVFSNFTLYQTLVIRPINTTPRNPSHLPLHQIPNHLPSRNPGRRPQRREIKRARKRIRIPKRHHGRDPSSRILEGETRTLHLVLLDVAAAEMVYRTHGVNLWLELAGDEGELFAFENVEVIVGGMATGVTFGSEGRAEDYEVFSYAWERKLAFILEV